MSPTTAHTCVELDGSTLEGGGQLLRNAVALSALTRTPVHIPNVRQGRNQPGLKPQHAAGEQQVELIWPFHLLVPPVISDFLAAHICGAHAEGVDKGSRTVSFDPVAGSIRAGAYQADPGTAGSTTLLFQISLPCLLFPEPPSTSDKSQGDDVELEDSVETISTLTLRGGTNALNAPPADYAQTVLVPFLNTHILPPSSSSSPLILDMKQRGFFPHGGGVLLAVVPGVRRGETLRSVTLTDRGEVVSVQGTVYVSGVIRRHVAEEMRRAALEELALCPELSASGSDSSPKIRIDIEVNGSGRPGSGIILRASTSTGCVLCGSALGKRGTRAAETGRVAAQELVRNLEEAGCVDEWMQDQMIVFLALAKGRSVVRTGRVTLHTRTAIWVAERLTDAKFEVTENLDGTEQSSITCEGIGLEGRL